MNPDEQDGVQRRFSVARDRTSRRYSITVSACAVPSRLKLSPGSQTGNPYASSALSSPARAQRRHPSHSARSRPISIADAPQGLGLRRWTNKATIRRRLPGWKAYRARKNAELAQAVKVGDMRRARQLLQDGADINMKEAASFNRSLVHLAIHYLRDDHNLAAEIAHTVITFGADCTARDDMYNTPLHLACASGNIPAARVLLDRGLQCTDENKQGESCLYLTVEKGNAPLVRLLLCQPEARLPFERHASPRTRNALYRAALESSNVDVLSELIQHHIRTAQLSFDDIEKALKRQFSTVPSIAETLASVRASLPSAHLPGLLTDGKQGSALSTSTLGRASGRLLSVARMRTRSGDELLKAATTAASVVSAPRTWLGSRTVRVERGPGGRFNFDVTGGAESMMLPRVVLKANITPCFRSTTQLHTGDEIVAVDNCQVAGMSHDAVVRVLKSAKETITLTVLPANQRTPFQNGRHSPKGKSKATSAFTLLPSSAPITTRPPLQGERQGRDYSFVSVALFQYLLHNNFLREWGQLNSHFYGSLKSTVEVCPVRDIDTLSPGIHSRCGDLKVAHVQRNTNNVFGFMVAGGAAVGELPYVSTVFDTNVVNADKAPVLPNDAILAVDGVTVAAETSAAVTELISAGGHTVRLLLLSHSFQGVREYDGPLPDNAIVAPTTPTTAAASSTELSARDSVGTGVVLESKPFNQQQHARVGALATATFNPPGVDDFGVQQAAAEVEQQLSPTPDLRFDDTFTTTTTAATSILSPVAPAERMVKAPHPRGEHPPPGSSTVTGTTVSEGVSDATGEEEVVSSAANDAALANAREAGSKRQQQQQQQHKESGDDEATAATAAAGAALSSASSTAASVRTAPTTATGEGGQQDGASSRSSVEQFRNGETMHEEEDKEGEEGQATGGKEGSATKGEKKVEEEDKDALTKATLEDWELIAHAVDPFNTEMSEEERRVEAQGMRPPGNKDEGDYMDVVGGEESDTEAEPQEKVETKEDQDRPVDVEQAMRTCISKLSQDQALYHEFSQLARVGVGATSEHSARNRSKNRYRNITAYDHTRVILDILEGDDDCDYYNANFLPDDESESAYIACQGPTPPSTEDFWRMVWQKGVSVIVMVTKERELGRVKCHRYWPTLAATKAGQPMEMGYYTVRCLAERVTFLLTERTLELERFGEPKRTVKQVQYHSWPDHGIPTNPEDLLLFRKHVRSVQRSIKPRGPLLVHCSAGVGRSGTFIVLDRIMRRLEKHARGEAVTADTVDVRAVVHDMRKCRNLMVQTAEQYVFLFKVITHLLSQCRQFNTLDISSHLQDHFAKRQHEFENAYDSLESMSENEDED